MQTLEKIVALDAALRERLAPLSLGEFPTPVTRLSGLSGLGAQLWVKRDDACSSRYGGNKVRKLELLLAEARRKGAKSLLTFGGVGSNHAVACAAHAGSLNFKVHAIVLPQPLTASVRKNLLAAQSFGAALHYAPNPAAAGLAALRLRARLTKEDGVPPYLISPGGSSVLGSTGYALAALELAAQIARGEAPLPAALFVPVGSAGTLAGLMAGVALAALPVQLVGIQVVSPLLASRALVGSLARRVLGFCRRELPKELRPRHTRIPKFSLEASYFGGGYGSPTPEGADAMARAAAAGLSLDPTYTGKTFAAVLDAARKSAFAGRALLFWNTYSSVDLSARLADTDWHALPKPLQRYFDGTLELVGEPVEKR